MTKAYNASSSKKTLVAKASKSSKTKIAKSNGKFDEVKKNIFHYVCKQNQIEDIPVGKEELALAMGFKNPRSEGFAKPLKALISDDMIRPENKGGTIIITEKGRSNMPKDLEVSTLDKSAKHKIFKEIVVSKLGGKNSDKVDQVWDILMDGKEHTILDIAEEMNYKNPRSFGNTKIIQTMKEKGLVEETGKGVVKFTSKVHL